MKIKHKNNASQLEQEQMKIEEKRVKENERQDLVVRPMWPTIMGESSKSSPYLEQ